MAENALAQHPVTKFYTSMKTISSSTCVTKESHFSSSLLTKTDSVDGCVENGVHSTVQKCVSFESKNVTATSINGQSKRTSETTFCNGKETKSFIQQRVERLYGPGALAQAFFVPKRQKNRLSESEGSTSSTTDRHSKSLTDKLLEEESEPTMKQSTSSPTLPVLRHLRPEFRAQLPIISPRKLTEPIMPKSITVPKLKNDECSVKVNGHSKVESNGLSKVPSEKLENGESASFKECLSERDGNYFIKILDEQTARLLQLADSVEQELQDNPNLSEDVVGKVMSAAGKARLLVTQKMQQFRGLCTMNINRSVGEDFPTTNEDLQGFWDMVMLQVDQVDKLLNEISVLKKNNWIEEVITPPEVKTNGAAKPRKSVTSRPSRSSTGANEEARKQREEQRKKMIEERRKAMKAHQQTKPSIEIFVPESS